MSNYTKLDSEVTFLDTSDRVEYEYDILQHDVEKNIEMSYGLSALTNPKSIRENFKDPKKIGLAILTLLIFILTLSMFILVVFHTFCWLKGDAYLDRREKIGKLTIPMLMFLLLLLIFYMIYNKFYEQVISLIILSKDNKTSAAGAAAKE
jgi:hypothetical protein